MTDQTRERLSPNPPRQERRSLRLTSCIKVLNGFRDDGWAWRMSPSTVMTRRAATASVLALVAVVTLGGCFGDPPPDPAEAGLEVVLEGCVLNRAEVAPGTHEVVVINFDQYQPGSLVVSDKDGTEVLTVAVGDTDQLVTTAQTYTFTCSVGSNQSTSMLQSIPR